MKCKSIVVAGMFLFAFSFAASNAKADNLCSLSVSNSYPLVGQSFSYGVDITVISYNGPRVGPWYVPAPFTVVFHGSKNGVDDIPPGGETYPATFNAGHSDLTGYYNPGGYSGTYLRYALIYDEYGNLYCTTNTVAVVLQ